MSRRVVSRLAAGTGTLVIAAAVAAATVPAADAAVTSRATVPAPAATHGQARTAANNTAVAARHQAAAIVCHMVFQGANGGLPHHSGHFPGSIDVRVRVTCTRPVTSILGYVV